VRTVGMLWTPFANSRRKMKTSSLFRAQGIYDAKTMDVLGSVSEHGYERNRDRVIAAFPDLNLVALRKATLLGRPRQR